eukprot:CAMPEP_0196130242 /NCGR_PEP_ID=MMETSP0910-20130528/685_1 /TAXON_ID=49265 /ORGANISM="Thalassiosira rotula, Strain GSO102" /LENGTH=61 /DNA_ID=CAMNT_0041389509 /DNA_START=316 /DNA_END=501 /DNA_ORIENTATION=-
MARYSTSDFRRGGQLEAMRTILDFPVRSPFTPDLYPRIAFPDFMTSLRREFMDSTFFFCSR